VVALLRFRTLSAPVALAPVVAWIAALVDVAFGVCGFPLLLVLLCFASASCGSSSLLENTIVVQRHSGLACSGPDGGNFGKSSDSSVRRAQTELAWGHKQEQVWTPSEGVVAPAGCLLRTGEIKMSSPARAQHAVLNKETSLCMV